MAGHPPKKTSSAPTQPDRTYHGLFIPYDEANEPVRIRQHQGAAQGLPIKCAECDTTALSWLFFRCLYCLMWFCKDCSENHYGKTREQWFAEKEEDENP